MPGTQPLTLTVSDIVNWFRRKELVINEDFQRRAVWTPAAKTFLVDSLLKGFPLPKLYIRTKIDPVTQQMVREVVDGQQRVRSIVEFANDKLKLTSRSTDYSGKKYSDLNPEDQERFLGYVISADQLLNASDDEVLEVFSRLNSYTVILNDAEKRHAEFQTDFKWLVVKTAAEWSKFFDEKGVLSIRQRVRMMDDELVAEMFRVLVGGVCDGGARKLRAFYREQDDETFTAQVATRVTRRLTEALRFLQDSIADWIRDELARPYYVLAMFAAYAHHRWGIPKGDLDVLPDRKNIASPAEIGAGLDSFLENIQRDVPTRRYQALITETTRTSPQRIAARRVRFLEMVRIFGS